MNAIRFDEVAPSRWRNGGGTTRELIALPAGGDAWCVRVSVADVEADGAFSSFPGVRRWFAVLEGEGVELTIDGGERVVVRRGDAPVAFDGGVPTHCRLLDGPTRDLNLMLRGVGGRLERVEDGLEWRPGAPFAALLTGAEGSCRTSPRASLVPVPARSLVVFDPAPQALAFERTSVASMSTPAPSSERACGHATAPSARLIDDLGATSAAAGALALPAWWIAADLPR